MQERTLDPSAFADTLRFRLTATRTLPRSAIRIGVLVHGLVSAEDLDHAALVHRVDQVLHRFVDAAWTVSAVKRAADDAGLERVTLSASAQVPARENYNLDERARRASEPGLAIGAPEVDYRLPGPVMASATTDLQEDILHQVAERIARFTTVTNRQWRIGDVQFGLGNEYDDGTSPKLVRREVALLSGASGGSDDDDLLTTSERLVMVAGVTLRADPPA